MANKIECDLCGAQAAYGPCYKAHQPTGWTIVTFGPLNGDIGINHSHLCKTCTEMAKEYIQYPAMLDKQVTNG